MADNAEEWLATEDPTEGDLPTTDFIGSTKDLSQSVDPEEGDGTEIEEVPERNFGDPSDEVPVADVIGDPEDGEPTGVLAEGDNEEGSE